ncbi:unnamed protein product [Camellia sinensis]
MIIALKNREPTESINLNKETEGSSSNRSENSSEIKLDISTRTPLDMDSPSSNHHHGHPIIPTSSSRPLFPPSIITRPTSAAVAHLFPNSSSSSRQPNHKIIDHQNVVKEESFSNINVAIIKSSKDTRYAVDSVVTHDGTKFPCWALPDLLSFRQKFGDEAYAKLDVIGIDEAQFFGDLYDFCCKVADHDGKTVIVAGLDGDYLSWEYFGAFSWAASPEFW